MNVKASHQNKLKRALENYRSTGQFPTYADPSTPPHPPSYSPQLPPGGPEAMATGALAGTSVADGLGSQAYGQAYAKGGLWIDTNPEAQPPYQWVDGPPGAGG